MSMPLEKAMIRFVIRSLFFLGILFLLSGCQANPVSPSEAIGLLTKCKDVLSLCVLLLSQSEGVRYSYVAERYYYAMLSLARIVAGKDWLLGGLLREKKGKHERVWGSCPKNVKELYGEQLKHLRVRCDYGVERKDFQETEYEAGLKTILNHEDAYNSLKEAVQNESLEISSRPSFSEEFNDLLDKIDDLRNTLKKKL